MSLSPASTKTPHLQVSILAILACQVSRVKEDEHRGPAVWSLDCVLEVLDCGGLLLTNTQQELCDNSVRGVLVPKSGDETVSHEQAHKDVLVSPHGTPPTDFEVDSKSLVRCTLLEPDIIHLNKH